MGNFKFGFGDLAKGKKKIETLNITEELGMVKKGVIRLPWQ